MVLVGFRHFWFFKNLMRWSNTASRPGWLHWTWKCIVSLSLSRFVVDVLFASISKILQKHPTQIQKERTHKLILATFLLSRTIFTSLLVTLLPQPGGHFFFQHPRAVIKTLLWMKLLPTEMGNLTNVITLLLYYLLCELSFEMVVGDHFQKAKMVPLPSTWGIKNTKTSCLHSLNKNLTW